MKIHRAPFLYYNNHMITYKKVTKNEIQSLAKLASNIWHEYWTEILTLEQINYMVENFQSENAINNQYTHENYTYYFIQYNEKNIGYFGISAKKDYLFLSKLYISKDFRHKGIGGKTFEKIKQIANEEKYSSIQLTVNKYNKNTISAYEKWGFSTIDSVVTDIGQGFVMDDYIMEYNLP